MGANLYPADVANITSGRRRPTQGEYQILAAALNEELGDQGKDHPVRAWPS